MIPLLGEMSAKQTKGCPNSENFAPAVGFDVHWRRGQAPALPYKYKHKLKFSQKNRGIFRIRKMPSLSFCIYNLFCCTSGADCALNPNARHSAREIADNPIPVRVCGFAENRRADCDGLQYGSVRGRNSIQIPVRCAEDQGVAVQNRCAFHRLCLADIRRSAHQRIADGRFPQNFMCGKSAKATKSARAFAVFFLKYLLKSTPFQWYNNR